MVVVVVGVVAESRTRPLAPASVGRRVIVSGASVAQLMVVPEERSRWRQVETVRLCECQNGWRLTGWQNPQCELGSSKISSWMSPRAARPGRSQKTFRVSVIVACKIANPR